ncbi:MAG: carbohydrate ABC transporter permease [Clostridiales bacterium]|jgi:putative aldouronate transport system permease protein|nr:carbohydrate ABC transporter permease [Clostridiales bacterium]
MDAALHTKKVRISSARKAFVIINYALMLAMAFVFFAPYINILAKSLNSAADTELGGISFFPRVWSWNNFHVTLSDPSMWQGFKITALRVVIGSLFSLLVTYMAAYGLLRKNMRFRRIIVAFLTLPMFIGGGIVATYIVYAKIKVYDSFLVYILPTAFSFYNMVIIRTYLLTVPESLRESARIDGAGELRIMFQIMLPLSMPVVATILLWNAVGHWNDWTTTLYYINSASLYTMQFNLQQSLKEAARIQEMIAEALASGRLLGDSSGSVSKDSILSAQIIVSTLPIILVYPFLQRYFISGVMIGGVKE